MLMVNGDYFRAVKTAAERTSFRSVISASDDQIDKQRHMEFAVRFLVHTYLPYNGTLDVEEYIDEGVVRLATAGEAAEATKIMDRTFDLLNAVAGKEALRRFEAGRHTGKVGLVALEGIAVGVAKNIDAITALPNPKGFVRQKIETFWSQPEAASFTSPGLRGTTRIQRTVPFGEHWFKP